MNTIFKYTGILMIFLGMISCHGLLDQEPIGRVGADEFFETEEDAILAVNAAYQPMQFEETKGAWHMWWFFSDIPSDDATKGGENEGDQVGVYHFETFQADPTNFQIVGLWAALYQGIYRANVVLDNVPGVEIEEQMKHRILAEAHFLRAFYYFRLVRIFGGVPLVDHVLDPSEFKMGRASKAEIYDLIEADLTFAKEHLPVKSSYDRTELGRATKGAALALLSKVYVYEQNWQGAKSNLEALFSLGEYNLDSEFQHIFAKDGEHGVESIFEINHTPSPDGWGNANQGTTTPIFCGPRAEGGWGFNQATQSLVDAFEPNDPRKRATITEQYEQPFGTGFYGKKYTYTWESGYKLEDIGDAQSNGAVNVRVMRLADMYLYYAEAAYHTGDEATALQYVNKVRDRVGMPEVKASGTSVLEAIYHERRVELAFEGNRFFDLVRTGRAAKILEANGFKAGKSELFPIPVNQIAISGGLITQNPNY